MPNPLRRWRDWRARRIFLMARAGTLTLQPPPPHPAPDGANTTFDALVGCAVAIARWYRIWDWRANLPVEPLAPALVAIRRAPQNNPALHCEDGPPLFDADGEDGPPLFDADGEDAPPLFDADGEDAPPLFDADGEDAPPLFDADGEDAPPLLTPSHVTEANLEATTERLASALAEVDQLTTSPPACSIS